MPIQTWCIFGLAIITIGSGFFLPSLPPLINNLYVNNEKGRDSGFTLYYLCKNVGALLGPIICGIVAQHFGFNYAFLLSAIVMFIGLFIFIFGQKHLYYGESASSSSKRFFTAKHYCVLLGTLITIPLMQLVFVKNIDGYLLLFGTLLVLGFLAYLFFQQSHDERKKLALIITLLIFATIFIAFLAQGGSTLNLFIERIVNRHVFGIIIPTSVFYALDPIFMLSLGPFLALFFLKLSNKNKEPSAITKSSSGLLLLALGFSMFSIAAYIAETVGTSSPLFIVAAYFLFPIAELLVVPPILSSITKLSPKNNVSMMVSIFMFSQGLGGYLTGQISKLGTINFEIHSIATKKAASVIYQHAFFYCFLILLVASGILLMIGYTTKKLEFIRQ